MHIAALIIALGQALESSDRALTERRENEVYQEELNAGVDYALVTFLPSFLSEHIIPQTSQRMLQNIQGDPSGCGPGLSRLGF